MIINQNLANLFTLKPIAYFISAIEQWDRIKGAGRIIPACIIIQSNNRVQLIGDALHIMYLSVYELPVLERVASQPRPIEAPRPRLESHWSDESHSK